MNRRTLLTLTGLALVPQVSRAQTAKQRTLVLADAPIRSTFEMVLKNFGKNNFTIANSVVGLITLKATRSTFEEVMDAMCLATKGEVAWHSEAGTVLIEGKSGNPDALMAIFQKAKMPLVDGIPCRMAGCVLGGASSLAILEIGNPPDSEITIVELGREVAVQGKTYRVEKISEKELTLVSATKTLQIPLAPLVPSKTLAQPKAGS